MTSPKESATRKCIDIVLNNLDWCTDERKPDCNVFTERAKTNAQNKKLKGHPDYVLYESGTDNPIAIIEAKKLGQDLQKALKQGASYAKDLDVGIVFATDGTIIETFYRKDRCPLRLDDEFITDFLSEKELLKFVGTSSSVYTPEKIFHTKRELIKIFGEANKFLRKEGLREGVERFSEFSTLLFLKLISELEGERERLGEKRLLEKTYCWESFCNKQPKELLDYINDSILPRLVDKYNHSGDVFESKLLIQNPSTLKKIVDKLSSLQLLNTDSDVKGDAFEYFLKNSITVGNDLGEYFTPRHIVKLIVELIDPKFDETVYDPCCGTGGFLIQAFRHVENKCKHTKKNLEKLRHETIYGRELTGTAKIAKMNMIIIGDGHTNIKQMNSLKNQVKNEYDVVLTNYPFSQETDYGFSYGYDTENANPVFLQHVIDALRQGGRAGVVVPEGILFDDNLNSKKIRKNLIDKCNLIAVIALNSFVFRPYTGQPTSILIFEKGNQTKKVWFFNVYDDGYKQTSAKKGRPPIRENDLLQLRKLWLDKQKSDKSFSVNVDTIRNNNYKLSLTNYLSERQKTNCPKLGDVCDIRIGGTPKRDTKSFWVDGGNLWVKIKDMRFPIINDTEEKISDAGVSHSNVKLIPKGSILYSFKLTIGVVSIAGKNLYTNEAIAAIIPRENTLLPKYLYYVLPRIDVTHLKRRAAKGYTLNTETLKKIEIPIPPVQEQKDFINSMRKSEVKMQGYKNKIADLSSKQDSLVLKLMKKHTELIN